MYTQGQIIKNADGKRKILGVCGEVYFVSCENNFQTVAGFSYTQQDLDNMGYTLDEAEWEPKEGEKYYHVDSYGDIYDNFWATQKGHIFRLSTGNVHRTKEAAEEYKERLKTLKK